MLTKTGYGYKQLRLLRLNQDNFSVWAALDPNMQKSSDGQARVRWSFTSQLPYPVNLMLLFVDVEGMIAGDLQQGLENLKLILEMPLSEVE